MSGGGCSAGFLSRGSFKLDMSGGSLGRFFGRGRCSLVSRGLLGCFGFVVTAITTVISTQCPGTVKDALVQGRKELEQALSQVDLAPVTSSTLNTCECKVEWRRNATNCIDDGGHRSFALIGNRDLFSTVF